jgi:hypothetical protein
MAFHQTGKFLTQKLENHEEHIGAGYDPIVMQLVVEHVEETGPDITVIVLQFPSTASSGLRLIATTLGGSYVLRWSRGPVSDFIPECSCKSSAIRTTASTPSGRAGSA